jgi:hypothetical protein
MPTWGQILIEVNQSAAARAPQGPDVDGIRQKYIQALQQLSGRAVIVYASGWLKGTGESLALSVEGGDVHALMEVCHGVPERELDLVLHSPGGSAQAAEQMVNYLRTQFDHIRALVPLQAKSAATIIALGCDEIVLGNHSELGPIDPQILMPMPGGGNRFAPAHAIIRDFERAKSEIGKDVSALPAWTPILHAYGGGLLDYCTQQIQLSQDVVAGWMERYMLSHDDVAIPVDERAAVARSIAEYFGAEASYDRFRTHGRPIRIEELRRIRGLRIRALEDDAALQDALLSVYHVLDITFGGPAVKIVENHNGSRHVRLQQNLIIQTQQAPPSQPGPAPTPPVAPGVPQPSRAERRRAEKAARKGR